MYIDNIIMIKNNIKKEKIIIQNYPVFRLDNLSTIEYYDNFISDKLHDDLVDELLNLVPLTHGIYNMFGKPVKTPRLLYSMCGNDFDVQKVYNITNSMYWTNNVLILKKLIEEKTGKTYKYAQLNYYRNGDDYIGYHTDSEVAHNDVIASVSLGANRKFLFRNIDYKKSTNKQIYEIILKKKSLIIMDEYSAKKYWKHSLPKMKNLLDYRINITFRNK